MIFNNKAYLCNVELVNNRKKNFFFKETNKISWQIITTQPATVG